MNDGWIPLPTTGDWPASSASRLSDLVRLLDGRERSGGLDGAFEGDARHSAASGILIDLFNQGWSLRTDDLGSLFARPPDVLVDAVAEKDRVRSQERLKRDEQVSNATTRAFVAKMESPREFDGRFVSIFSLMRDGAELVEDIKRALRGTSKTPTALNGVVKPYIQFVSESGRCAFTGLRLVDIWRYFRLTWSSQYTSTPGRTMSFLIRDASADFHPVIGIAALGSPVIQIAARDKAIGWRTDEMLATIQARASGDVGQWLMQQLDSMRDDLFAEDLIADELYWPGLWHHPDAPAIERLSEEASARRRKHQRFVRRSDFGSSANADSGKWRQRAESDLFRSKRCQALADLLRWRAALVPYLEPKPTAAGLEAAMTSTVGRDAIKGIVRRVKAAVVGTEVADLIVCGALPPYAGLLGGKLTSVLAVSPTVIREYRRRYESHVSEIASSMAGRPVVRRANLAFVGTTSLYGAGSSQYNRIRVPAAVLGGSGDLWFKELGRSRSFGTSQFSTATVASLVRFVEQSHQGTRVNSIFGEGVNPKLRKVRDGLDLLGWPSDDLLRHRRERIVYGVDLLANTLEYLMGIDPTPRYLAPLDVDDDIQRLSDWWVGRWFGRRIGHPGVLTDAARHSHRFGFHGARVVVPHNASGHALDTDKDL